MPDYVMARLFDSASTQSFAARDCGSPRLECAPPPWGDDVIRSLTFPSNLASRYKACRSDILNTARFERVHDGR